MLTPFAKKMLIGTGIFAAIAVLFFVFIPRKERFIPVATFEPPTDVTILASPTHEEPPSVSPTPIEVINPLTGEVCNNALRRPIAVMLSGDTIARPLSGLAQADMVFEMPVINGSITRFMAVFVCRDPIEIGSVRSARHNFIPLARSLDAIYAHWGGSHFALDLLNKHAIDNIDALPNPTGAYWRKENSIAPHNGFTSMTRLWKAAKFLQYRLEGAAPIYMHTSTSIASTIRGSLEIGFAGEFKVRYEYDPTDHAYTRIRGNITERDKNLGETVKVRNIVIMRTIFRQIEGQYNDVAVDGQGDTMLYQNGKEILGKWKKDAKDPTSKLLFLDTQGNEIPFVPGNIWVEIVEPYTNVSWKTE